MTHGSQSGATCPRARRDLRAALEAWTSDEASKRDEGEGE